jgi:hypothetical protein
VLTTILWDVDADGRLTELKGSKFVDINDAMTTQG